METFSQIHPLSLREQVVNQVRAAIIEGRLRPDDHITEASLTRQLGVSRTPVREALILLEREGLLVSIPNRGCFVRAFDARDVSEIFSLRTALENFAAELGVNRLAPPDFAHLRGLIAQQRVYIDQADMHSVRRVDMGFHEYLVASNRHRLLTRSWTEIVAQIAALLHIRAAAFQDFDEYTVLQDHRAIVEAYEGRDLAAIKHLNTTINERTASECTEALRHFGRIGAQPRG